MDAHGSVGATQHGKDLLEARAHEKKGKQAKQDAVLRGPGPIGVHRPRIRRHIGKGGRRRSVGGDSKEHVDVGNEGRIGLDELAVDALQRLVADLEFRILYNRRAERIDVRPGIAAEVHRIGCRAHVEDGDGVVPGPEANLEDERLEEVADGGRIEFKGQPPAPLCRSLVDRLLANHGARIDGDGVAVKPGAFRVERKQKIVLVVSWRNVNHGCNVPARSRAHSPSLPLLDIL